jgi:adenosylhomocysteine nucleosidase
VNEIQNSGVLNIGGNTIANNAVGDHAAINLGHDEPAEKEPGCAGRSWHFGIITILAKETRAVLDVLGLDDGGAPGQGFYTGHVDGPGGVTNLVATQSSDQGQLAVGSALNRLRERYNLAVVALVGIAGAIDRKVALNDVVVGTRVVYYENRKVVLGRTKRRGQEFRAPSGVTRSVNRFFTSAGDPATLPASDGSARFLVHSGLIGSGEAVVGDADDEIRRYLINYNDKILAVEMEAGGLARWCHDATTSAATPLGWLVVRGISDRADATKNDLHHDSAARNAAQTLRHLIPYIHPRL